MAFDAIVRVSFQTDVQANQAVNKALVGDSQNSTGTGPFTKIGTALYSCTNANDSEVAGTLVELSKELKANASSLDFCSITLAKRS